MGMWGLALSAVAGCRPRAALASSLVLLVCGLAGCVPGAQLGVRAPGNDQPSGLLSDDVSARADIFAINAETLAKLNDEETIRQANLKKQRPHLNGGNYQYLIGPQDILRITVWDHPELNNPAGVTSEAAQGRVVNNDGSLFYPYVGMIQVAGKTVQQLREYLEKQLARALTNPQVDVAVQDFRSQRVMVTGELKTPGLLPITDIPMYIADAVSLAGGVTQNADLANASLVRDGQTYSIDLYALFYSGDLSQNALLRQGDAIHIPERNWNKAFIMGEVMRPASLPIPRGKYTLSEALADAGGASQVTSDPSQIYVIRTAVDGRSQIYHLNAKRPDAFALADSFLLRPRDVIFVDAASVTRWNRVVTQILPSAQIVQAGAYSADRVDNLRNSP